MTITERRKYLARMLPRYLAADRPQQSLLLTEMQTVTGLHRKSLLRLLNASSLARQPRSRQRTRTYGAPVDDALRLIWETLDYVCAERLTPALVSTAHLLAHHGELTLTDDLLAQLGQISVASVQRRLSRFTQDTPRLPRKGPERANRIAKAIPMRTIPWDQAEPGHFEVDLVHHGGPSPIGDFVYTLQLIDVATGWSERVAILGRSQVRMEEGFRRVLARLPFPVKELHSDNGSEFLNDHLVRFFGEAITGLQLSRSRPYQKNDNRFVEQKNSTLVRAYLGTARLDTAAQAAVLNALYDQMWGYYNLFQPVMHLKEKVASGTRLLRKWDTAQTPFSRLQATGVLSEKRQAALEAQVRETNPRRLRQTIYKGLRELLQGEPPREMLDWAA
ncbi:MAG: integrase [Chloroflexota bacterium]|nr:integrase [Chloroflexota bacterium]